MQNIKGFKLTAPTKKQLQQFADPAGDVPAFLTSVDGQDWYECQSQFADDTVKIMYDSTNCIRAIVDKPVARRGNTLAVSVFYPLGMSVAELATLPEGCRDDGSWCFADGVVSRNPAWHVQRAETSRQHLLAQARAEMVPLQSAMLLDDITDKEAQRLKTLLAYIRTLGAVDISANPDTPLPEYPN